MNISASDSIVSEYLIFRGFTHTYKSLETERRRDKTKAFEVLGIVDTIFNYLHGYEILNFVSLWDFMSKRFFVHLDLDHLQLSNDIKADLLKYYLVNAVKTKEKEKIVEFFQMYSHEILQESGARSLRSWYILPYIDQPHEDKEFSSYFTTKWIDGLRLSLNNFLTIVLSTAPPPKLLLLERWYRSEAQQEIRSQLKQSFQKVDILVDRLETNEKRLIALHEVVKELVAHVMKASVGGLSRGSVGLFDDDKEAEGRRQKVKEIGQVVSRLSQECSAKGHQIQKIQDDEIRLREILGNESSPYYFGAVSTEPPSKSVSSDSGSTLEELENKLLEKLNLWLKTLST